MLKTRLSDIIDSHCVEGAAVPVSGEGPAIEVSEGSPGDTVPARGTSAIGGEDSTTGAPDPPQLFLELCLQWASATFVLEMSSGWSFASESGASAAAEIS